MSSLIVIIDPMWVRYTIGYCADTSSRPYKPVWLSSKPINHFIFQEIKFMPLNFYAIKKCFFETASACLSIVCLSVLLCPCIRDWLFAGFHKIRYRLCPRRLNFAKIDEWKSYFTHGISETVYISRINRQVEKNISKLNLLIKRNFRESRYVKYK